MPRVIEIESTLVGRDPLQESEGEGKVIALALRSIGSSDYVVIEDGHQVGRIRLAAERHNGLRVPAFDPEWPDLI